MDKKEIAYNKICLRCCNTCKYPLSDGYVMKCPYFNIPREIKNTKKKTGK